MKRITPSFHTVHFSLLSKVPDSLRTNQSHLRLPYENSQITRTKYPKSGGLHAEGPSQWFRVEHEWELLGEFVEKQTPALQPQKCRFGAGLRNMHFKSWLRLGWGGVG